MANEYLTGLAEVISACEIPDFSAGASGYFSEPQKTLDPALFDGDQIKPEVRSHIIDTLFRFWKMRGLNLPEAEVPWVRIWLAGSGVSYQWAGDRGSGDLDVLLGIDWPRFYLKNPQWGQTGVNEITDYLNEQLWHDLWPRTAHTEFGGQIYEVTYYVNQDATDIRDINPYAAIDLSADTWTVHPTRDTAYQRTVPSGWQAVADQDLEAAAHIRQTVHQIQADLPLLDGPYWTTAMTQLSHQIDYAVGLMKEIHGNRHRAFRKPLGLGYADYHNWRWQMAKRNGVVAVLGALERAHKQAVESTQRSLYGVPLETADVLLMRAAQAYRSSS
ncbi:hypothetical protein [Streptomyces tubercidicus]|uniref:hypothetical protein n=1 Tax=Streptomyces tubercidicus TaxID=47759 RepID=UPI0036941153